LLFYLIIFISRFRLARSFSLIIFFSADNMFAAAFTIPIRPAAGQTIIDNNGVFSPFSGGRKLFLSGYKVDKTVSRLRRD
jgi:hypothetical protein